MEIQRPRLPVTVLIVEEYSAVNLLSGKYKQLAVFK